MNTQGETTSSVEAGAAWVYEGLWGVLTSLLKVPREAPMLPSLGGGAPVALKPGRAWLAYLRCWFWLGLAVTDGLLLGVWLLVCVVNPVVGGVLAFPVLVVAIVPQAFRLVTLYLKYDTTWYVISPRSIRLRNGVWTIYETTFTFENVQNVEITQGPIERWFGFANLKIETAGGGVVHTKHGPKATGSNMAYLFGMENAREIRELIMDRVRASRTTGLGDEGQERVAPAISAGWTAEHIGELRGIRDGLRLALEG